MANNHQLVQAIKKNKKFAIGLMSGTSMDGIDAALVKLIGYGLKTKVELVAFNTFDYPEELKKKLLQISRPGEGSTGEICFLNAVVGEYFLDAAVQLCKRAKFDIADVDLIGVHGQTVHHLPEKRESYGKKVASTLQIGDPAVIAARSGILTVGLFRNADVAVGGQGAPLVPYFDYLFFRHERKNRIILNIGGIANVTLLPKKSNWKGIIAFDTGPGNMIIDGLMRYFFNREFDRDGEIAASGNISKSLLEKLLSHPYLEFQPPKSTGREQFGEAFIQEIISWAKKNSISKQDVVATATEFTAETIFRSIKKEYFEGKVDEIVIGGGGVHNKTLLNRLQDKFPQTKIIESSYFGIPSDAKEAMCFAVLANETIHGIAANMPGVTGAEKRVVLGSIFLGSS